MVDKLDLALHSAEKKLEDLEQCGLRNCLILLGCKTSSIKKASGFEFEDFVLTLMNSGIRL